MSKSRVAFAFFSLGLFGWFPSVACASLVAYWDIEEGAGATSLDEINGNNDTLVDTTWVTNPADLAPALVNAGQTTAALSFNGISSVLDTAYEGIGGNNARTIALWVKLTDPDPPSKAMSLVTYGARNANGRKWHFLINSGSNSGRVPGAVRTEAQGGNQTGSTDLSDGMWHHVASVFPGGAGGDNADVLHYVDGMLEDATGTTSQSINTGTGGGYLVSIGARRQSANDSSILKEFLNGMVDDVRIYDEALGPEQIQLLANPTTIPEPSSIVLGLLGVCGWLALAWRRRRLAA